MPTTPPPPMATVPGPGSGSGSGSGSQGAQGVVLCPRTLSQVRRSRLRRALTEATAETVNYVKTVGTILPTKAVMPNNILTTLLSTHRYFIFLAILHRTHARTHAAAFSRNVRSPNGKEIPRGPSVEFATISRATSGGV